MMGALFACLVDEEGLDKHERERLNVLQRGAIVATTLDSWPYLRNVAAIAACAQQAVKSL